MSVCSNHEGRSRPGSRCAAGLRIRRSPQDEAQEDPSVGATCMSRNSTLSSPFVDTDNGQEKYSMQDHARALGQKYLGVKPQGNHLDEMFRDTTYRGDGNHPVPVSNFLNAQCMQSSYLMCFNVADVQAQTSPRSQSEPHHRSSRLSSIPAAQTSGSHPQTAAPLPATSTASTTIVHHQHTRRTARPSRSATAPAS